MRTAAILFVLLAASTAQAQSQRFSGYDSSGRYFYGRTYGDDWSDIDRMRQTQQITREIRASESRQEDARWLEQHRAKLANIRAIEAETESLRRQNAAMRQQLIASGARPPEPRDPKTGLTKAELDDVQRAADRVKAARTAPKLTPQRQVVADRVAAKKGQK